MKQTPETQFDRFAKTARKLGCDEDKERFEESLGKIAAAEKAKDQESRQINSRLSA